MADLKNRRWRRHLKFTREGKLFVFVTVGLGFGAVNTGTNLMYLVFAFMLSLIILSGILSEHVLRRLRISRRLPSRVFAGEATLIEIVARNAKDRLVSYSVEIEDRAQALANARRCYFLKIPPGSEQAASYRRVFPRRGVVKFESFRVATRFPFALFEKWRELPAEDSLIVYPARLATPLPKGLSHDVGERLGQARGRGTETRELRDYRANDELRAVHWRRTAALGRPIVREFERETGELLSIVIDNGIAAGDADALTRLEEQVSRATDLAERALARGHSVEICARGQRTPPLPAYASSDPLLRFLALLEPSSLEVPLTTPTRAARVVDMLPLASGQGERAA